MFDQAEITFVSTAHSGLAQIAAAVARVRAQAMAPNASYRFNAVDLPESVMPAAPGAPEGRIELGVDYDVHIGTLTQILVDRSDLLVVMSWPEFRATTAYFPRANRKTTLLSNTLHEGVNVVAEAEPSAAEFERRRAVVTRLVEAELPEIVRVAENARQALMQKIGMTTSLYFRELVQPTFAEILALFQRAGLRIVDWAHDMYDDIIYTPAQIDQFVVQLDQHNLACEIVHGFENAAVHAVTTGDALDRYVAVQSNRIELCAHLGGHAVVVHAPGIFWQRLGITMQEALEQSTVALDQLWRVCEQHGITLSLEDYGKTWEDRQRRLEFYANHYPHTFVTFCLELRENSDMDAYLQQVEPYADRLSVLHIHEERTKNDHVPPYFSVDWPKLARWLDEFGFPPRYTIYYIELMYRRRDFDGGPDEFLAHWLRYIRAGVGAT